MLKRALRGVNVAEGSIDGACNVLFGAVEAGVCSLDDVVSTLTALDARTETRPPEILYSGDSTVEVEAHGASAPLLLPVLMDHILGLSRVRGTSAVLATGLGEPLSASMIFEYVRGRAGHEHVTVFVDGAGAVVRDGALVPINCAEPTQDVACDRRLAATRVHRDLAAVVADGDVSAAAAMLSSLRDWTRWSQDDSARGSCLALLLADGVVDEALELLWGLLSDHHPQGGIRERDPLEANVPAWQLVSTESSWAALESMANRTLVPISDESRAEGGYG